MNAIYEILAQAFPNTFVFRNIPQESFGAERAKPKKIKEVKKQTSESIHSKAQPNHSKGGSGSSITCNSPWTMNSKKKKSIYEKSPIIGQKVLNRQKTIMQQMMYMKNVLNARNNPPKDSFMNTVAFSDGMGEVYSDSDHLNKALPSVSDDEIEQKDKKKQLFRQTSIDERRNSPAVPLDGWLMSKLVPKQPSNFRRWTKSNTNPDWRIMEIADTNRPSMFHPYQLGCIKESLNESNEKRNTIHEYSEYSQSEESDISSGRSRSTGQVFLDNLDSKSESISHNESSCH